MTGYRASGVSGRSLTAAILAIAALSGCAQKPGGRPSAPATIQPVSNAQQLEDVVSLLENGNEAAARKALKAMVKREPGDIGAAVLLDSMTADPVASLGARSFDYRTQPGDSFPDLAKRFLGNRLKFYALARYNGIAVPASVKSGTVIRIPGEAPRPVIVPVPKPAPTPPKPAPKAVPAPAPKPSVVNPAQAARLRGQGLALLNQGQVSRAVVILRQAAAMDPGNALIKRDLERAQRIRQTVKDRK
ncbi:LysM peptidoglycan-binding domain-containing protein [Sphingobium algorifonticola]|uniref:LysM domain-containing protein n=1 Tax=Sphingobium algorifonticola TaxID=2008318 RepID=A0A437JAB2_9SPHN|nr:LysM peptidoglycan-binding domain-containing protein [Sphingobium algorifonticola]RVT42242.1 LysM domain-containing protein [Sphingobium algorifonticola]